MRILVIPALVLALAGCQMESGGFGGSGGSGGGGGNPGIQLARDACVRAVEARGQQNVSITSAGGTSNFATVNLQSRRDPMTISATDWRCTFSYATGRASVRRA
jgi:hypothetical protein